MLRGGLPGLRFAASCSFRVEHLRTDGFERAKAGDEDCEGGLRTSEFDQEISLFQSGRPKRFF